MIAMALAVPGATYAHQTVKSWYEQFTNPNKEAYPWTFWYWMYGNVSDAGIKLDLHAMKDAGITGFYLMPIKSVADGRGLGGNSEQLSPEWWKRIGTVFSTADSLGLEMGIHFSDGFALAGGPWIKPEESMQRIVWSDTIVSGGKYNSSSRTVLRLPQPDGVNCGYYKDVAVFAYPAEKIDLRMPTPSVTFPFKATKASDIVMSYDEPFTLRSVKIVTGGNNYQAHRLKVYASSNGKDYSFVREISPARQGWQNTDAAATYSIPATTARYFKFSWSPDGSEPGSEDMDAAKWKPTLKISELQLSSESVVDGYEGKSGIVWRVSKAFPLAKTDCVPVESVIDISDNVLSGTKFTLPKGKWHIVRIGHTSTGHTNATGGGGRGLECDKFSAEAVRKQFDNWFAEIYRSVPKDVASRVLTRLHVDSWEAGSQNWSCNFLDEFKKRRGYDLQPWLLLYAGVPLKDSETSERVMRDIRTTIADLINDVFFAEVRSLADDYNCKLSTECVAPTMVSDGLRHYQFADYPMGEFWLNSPTHDKLNDMLDAVSGAHIYGKNIIQAEGFTEVRGTWDEHPGMLKQLLDHNYATGINSIVFHVNTHNPFTDKKPGMTLDGIGTFFQRDNTWWLEMPTFTDYIARSQALLQYGKPVSDIAVYTGDEIPSRAVLPERLTSTLPGLFSAKTLKDEAERKANIGQPLEVSPVGVTHTKNMTKADDWVNALSGYRYDSFNHDALNGCKVERRNDTDGNRGRASLITRNGTEYKVLVVPQSRPMNPDRTIDCWNVIDSISNLGVPVIKTVWNEHNLSSLGIHPDAQLPEGIDFTHRYTNDADIYFLTNQSSVTQRFLPHFRDTRSYAYLANAYNGKITAWNSTDSISLHSGDAVFCVFSDAKVSDEFLVSKDVFTALQDGKTMRSLDCSPWKVTFENTNRTVEMKNLSDWTAFSSDNDIRYYSGHAVYETSFRCKSLPKKGKPVVLDLGRVENMATVYVNGQRIATAWHAPYCVDITTALKKGNNVLLIVVVNTWANALQGNDEGKAPFGGIWTNGKYRKESKELLPAGLLGPVRISE